MKEPRFWSGHVDPYTREAAPLTRVLLTPLAWLYASVTARKIARAKPRKVAVKTICIGNLTAGGVGKSPVTMALRDLLTDKTGLRVASLSRGYGGRLKGPLKVDLSQHSARDVGDEPAMLAHRGETWIGAARDVAGEAMSTDGVDIILMDDGHQNPSLHKDLSLIVIDGFDPFGNGYVIPKGPLRERVTAGLVRADAIILMGDGDIPDAVKETGLPVLRARIAPTGKGPSGPVVAFAGIGRPEKFFDTLDALGSEVKDAVPFGDHHVYTPGDLSYLRALAKDHEAQLITTEKDYARLPVEARGDIITLPVEAQFETPELLDKILGPMLKQGDHEL